MQLLFFAMAFSVGSRFVAGSALGWALVGVAIVFLIAAGTSVVRATMREPNGETGRVD
jgi:hypothetical protein